MNNSQTNIFKLNLNNIIHKVKVKCTKFIQFRHDHLQLLLKRNYIHCPKPLVIHVCRYDCIPT